MQTERKHNTNINWISLMNNATAMDILNVFMLLVLTLFQLINCNHYFIFLSLSLSLAVFLLNIIVLLRAFFSLDRKFLFLLISFLFFQNTFAQSSWLLWFVIILFIPSTVFIFCATRNFRNIYYTPLFALLIVTSVLEFISILMNIFKPYWTKNRLFFLFRS